MVHFLLYKSPSPKKRSVMTAFTYFLRFKVFKAISIRPSFASLAGKGLMAAMALFAYSSAKARVCSMPLLWTTSWRACLLSARITQWHERKEVLLTRTTSPSWANFLPTRLPSSGFFSHANSRGAVASPSSRSAPAGFPSSSALVV